MYNEIIELYKWCKDQGISCELTELFDGYQINFYDGSDIVQHKYSYGSERGCVEPCGMERSYTPVDLNTIKEILLKKA